MKFLRTTILILSLLTFVRTARAITIGAGPAIGTDKHGTTWYQEFQDWSANDVRALDQNNDQHVKFNDQYDSGRDIIAFYSHDDGGSGNYYFRMDFFDLLFNAENGNLDVYVMIDCAAGGATALPDGVVGTTDRPWDICIKLYDPVNNDVVNASGASVKTGNWLGSYWRADLDGVEFGIKRQALINAGWDGSSPIYFQPFTTKDFNTAVIDTITPFNTSTKVMSGGIRSDSTVNRAKYAAIAHANQSIAARTQTQDHIYRDLGALKPGFVRTIDTHEMLGAPLNMHLSGSLISSLLWAKSSDVNRDGPAFLNRLKTFVQNGTGSIIGGVYSEHIMPYFEGEVNRASTRAFNDLAQSFFGLTTNDMKVFHTPERVIHSNTNWPHANPAGPLKGKPFEDILAGGYAATYLDEVTHLHWWFYPSETNNVGWDENNWGRWAGGEGNDEEPYHHKVHKINGVLTFIINDREDQAKFGNDDGGMRHDTRYTLLQKALLPDYAQITIVFDDWEAYAGNSFGQGANGNADQWHNTIRWAANHQWIQIVNLKDVVGWAQADPNWVVDHGFVYDKTMQTYEWLKKASEHSYDNWYYGYTGNGVVEEDFFNRHPRTDPNQSVQNAKAYGDMNTPGSLIRDSWDKITTMPAGKLKTLAEWAYSSMIFETAWHDENAPSGWSGGNWFDAYKSRNYQVTFNRAETGSSEDYNSTDPTSGWALRLHGHVRKMGIHADAAQWVQDIKDGFQGPTTVVQTKEVDDDNWPEYILKNDRVYLCFERWGARLLSGFVYDPVIQDAHQVIGVPAANPSEEHDGEGMDNNRCSAFKDRWATVGSPNTRYVDLDYALTAPVQGADYWEFTAEDGKIKKRVTLPRGRDAVRADYTLLDPAGVGTLYIRHGLGPNQLDLLKHGDANLLVDSDPFYYGLRNTQGGAAYAVKGTNNTINVASLPGAGYQNRELPLIEQVEVFNTASSFSTWLAFSPASANDIDGDGLSNALDPQPENPDIDGDGMFDGFENLYWNSPTGGDPNGDDDGDGMTNVKEFLAGTIPNGPGGAASVFNITSITPVAGSGLSIAWNCVSTKRYQVYFKDNWSDSWQLVVPDSILANTTSTNYVTGTFALTHRYYRVGVVTTP